MARFTMKEFCEFVENSQGCPADDMAAHFDVTRDKVLSTFRNCISAGAVVRREGVGGDLKYYIDKTEDDSPKQSALAKAISDMVLAVTQQVREQVDEQLNTLITAEVDAALADVQSRIRLKLAGASAQAQPQAVIPQPVAVAVPVAPVSVPVVAAAQKVVPFEFTNDDLDAPPPNIINVKSKRTTPKPSAKVADAPVIKQAAQPEKKHTVVIIGIHANKQELIKREFKDCFDLRMLNPDQYARIGTTVTPASKNLMWVDFIGHKHSDAVTSMGYEVINVHGGMTSLREMLTAIFVGEK